MIRILLLLFISIFLFSEDSFAPVAGVGDRISVNGTDARDANFLDNLFLDFSINTATTPDDVTSKFNYAETLAGNPALGAEECIFTLEGTNAGGFLCEGAANAFETAIIITDPTADRTITFPNATGEVSLLAQIIEDAELASNYSGVGACAANNAATTLNDNAAPTCSEFSALGQTIGDAELVSNYSGIGACSASQWASTLNDNAAPTCAQPAFSDISGTTSAGDYGAATIDGDDVNSNIAGRSLALTAASPDTLDADTELYTDTKCMKWENPVATDDFKSIWRSWGFASTITGVWCETDTGMVNLDLQIDDGTPADVMGTDLVCAATAVEDTTSLTGAMADGDRLDIVVTSVATTPGEVTVCWRLTKDD